jgi:hypothetical protein
MYPFTIKHLGKTQTYTLYAPTAQNRQDWCNKIYEALERHSQALNAQHANPFQLRVLADSIITSQEAVRSPKDPSTGRQIHIKGSPLSRAIDATDPERARPERIRTEEKILIHQGYKGQYLTPILCADTLSYDEFLSGSHYGSQLLVLGTDSGIYIGTDSEWRRVSSLVYTFDPKLINVGGQNEPSYSNCCY